MRSRSCNAVAYRILLCGISAVVGMSCTRGPARSPYVGQFGWNIVSTASSSSCDRSADPALEGFVQADASGIERTFGVPEAEQFAFQCEADIADQLRAAGSGRPLLFVYSGHGFASPDGSASGSQLCLERGNASVAELLAAIPTSVPWAIVILNGCEASYVDVLAARVPISVISASPQAIEAVLPRKECDPSRTPLIDALLCFAQRAEDPNCDGLITDQELFDSLSSQLAGAVSGHNPKLQRNATSHLPLPIRAKPCARGTDSLEDALAGLTDPKLTQELHKQARLRSSATELPANDLDYIYEQPANAGIMKQLVHNQLVPFPGSNAQARAFAAASTFADVFRVEVREQKIDVIRERDSEPVASGAPSSVSIIAGQMRLLAGRTAVLERCTNNHNFVVTFRRGFHVDDGQNVRVDGQLIPRARMLPMLCKQSDGMCFVANMSGVQALHPDLDPCQSTQPARRIP